jgi:hypothetical protein
MTEEEWLSCTEPTQMLVYLAGKVGERKLRLFACACCQRIRKWLFDSAETPHMLEAIERFADGEITSSALESIQFARWRASGLKWRNPRDPVFEAEGAVSGLWPTLRVDEVIRQTNQLAGYESLCRAAEASSHKRSYRLWKRRSKLNEKEIQDAEAEGIRGEQVVHAELLREIIDNPFHPTAIDPAWLTSTVVALAQGIYTDRAFDRMPILADALQDAGCENAAILDHCRDPKGVHVRGCFVVDLVRSVD